MLKWFYKFLDRELHQVLADMHLLVQRLESLADRKTAAADEAHNVAVMARAKAEAHDNAAEEARVVADSVRDVFKIACK